MLAAHAYKEERDAEKIAYAIGLAWGDNKKGKGKATGSKSDIEHLRRVAFGQEEHDGTPIQLTPAIVETLFAGDIVNEERPVIPKPLNEPTIAGKEYDYPEADIQADKEYLIEIDQVFDEIERIKKKGGDN